MCSGDFDTVLQPTSPYIILFEVSRLSRGNTGQLVWISVETEQPLLTADPLASGHASGHLGERNLGTAMCMPYSLALCIRRTGTTGCFVSYALRSGVLLVLPLCRFNGVVVITPVLHDDFSVHRRSSVRSRLEPFFVSTDVITSACVPLVFFCR